MGLRPDHCQKCGRPARDLKYCRKCQRYVCRGGFSPCWEGDAYTGYCLMCADLKRREEEAIKITVVGSRVYADGITCGTIEGHKGDYKVFNCDEEEIGGPFKYHRDAAQFARNHFGMK